MDASSVTRMPLTNVPVAKLTHHIPPIIAVLAVGVDVYLGRLRLDDILDAFFLLLALPLPRFVPEELAVSYPVGVLKTDG